MFYAGVTAQITEFGRAIRTILRLSSLTPILVL
jgi:hypothetical protein